MSFNKDQLSFINNIFCNNKKRISIAESITGGYLQFAFSQMKNASLFFTGGITAYSFDQKIKILKLDVKEAKNCNGGSSYIAEKMANYAAKLFNTEWAIGTSGCMISHDEDSEKFCYFSLWHCGNIIHTEKLELHKKTDLVDAQVYYTEFILGCLQTYLAPSS